MFTSLILPLGELVLDLRFHNILFSRLVLFITGVVTVYIYSYIADYKDYVRFILWTYIFSIRMIILILRSDLYILMLG